MASPIHAVVPGRARIRVGVLHRSSTMKQALERGLLLEPGIREVRASALTGNLLVRYDSGKDIASVLAAINRVARDPAVHLGPEQAATDIPVATWHVRDAFAVAGELGSAPELGLSLAEAQQRLLVHGANTIEPIRQRSVAETLVAQVTSLPVALLIGSALLSVMTGGIADAVVTLVVVGFNTVIGVSTERRAFYSIAALTRLTPPATIVVRDGVAMEVPSESVVPGDILLLQRGTWVSADARLLEVEDLTVDESALTGESMPVLKGVEALSEAVVPIADRTNMVYRATVCTGGDARAVVVATGQATEVGQVQRLLSRERSPSTPLERQLDVLGRQMLVVAAAASASVVGLGLARGAALPQIVRVGASLAVAAVPEGLPTVATTTLASGVRSLRRRDILVRRLSAVEALGAVHVVCLDKTGTITANKMQAMSVVAAGQQYSARVRDPQSVVEGASVPALRRLLVALALCSEATVSLENDHVVLEGTETEKALLQLVVDGGVDIGATREMRPLLRMERRTERRSFMTTLHAAGDGRRFLAMKGRPDEVLARSQFILTLGGVRDMTQEDRQEQEAQNERLAGQGLRVIAVAEQEGGEEVDVESESLTWLGLAAIADPPREGIDRLVERLNGAGIRSIMITGDQSATAYAIARTIGLGRGDELRVLDATQLEALDAEVLKSLVHQVDVFSRVSPSNKLQIVRALQSAGLVVAMTGDGVNDGPALHAADVGIALGRQGSDVAREVADIVLMNDDVAGLADAIAVGRLVGDDIRRAVRYILATNLSELQLTIGGIGLAQGEVLTPRQLLWLNVLTDVFPELALAVEPAHEDILGHPPGGPNPPLLSWRETVTLGREGTIIASASGLAWLYARLKYGPGPTASAVAFTTLSTAQLLHTVTARSRQHTVFDRTPLPPNPYVPAAITTGLGFELGAALIRAIGQIIGLAPISVLDLAVCGAFASGSLLTNESLKAATRPGRRASVGE